MSIVLALAKRHTLATFFVLAYALTWPVIPLVTVSPFLELPALFGPALAAIIVVVVVGGKVGLKEHLLSRLVRWRVGARWYAGTLGLLAVLTLLAAGLHPLLGAPTQGFFLAGVEPAREYWLLAAVYGGAALTVALVFGSNLSRKASMQAVATATSGPPA